MELLSLTCIVVFIVDILEKGKVVNYMCCTVLQLLCYVGGVGVVTYF